ncbi:MAG: ribonuclease P protein component [Pseudomonadota bacterium]
MSPSPRLHTLRHRKDFLRLRHGRRISAPGFLLQCAPHPEGEALIRVGYTATKKLGNAVTRNRAKRRLRALAAEVMPQWARPGHDYVFIAKDRILTRSYASLLDDLQRALVDPKITSPVL